MPAERSTPTKKSTQSYPTSPSKSGWSAGDKSLLFEHVIANGERDWDRAVPGKTAQQDSVKPCSMLRAAGIAWDGQPSIVSEADEMLESVPKTLLPMIRKTCGFMG
ncbi:hypothetical protein IAU59_005245 [Kwoniella sp. CBS 9459]